MQELERILHVTYTNEFFDADVTDNLWYPIFQAKILRNIKTP